jgi:universal stress protein A
MEVRNVLCPVDFGNLSAEALRHASSVAQSHNAKLTVVYANSFSPPPYFTEGRLAELERQHKESFHEAEAALREFIKATLGPKAATRIEVRVVEAAPADGIRRLALETHADLIVMGTHGRTGIHRLMLGSVADRVLRESDVPVLMVRAPHHPVETGRESLHP